VSVTTRLPVDKANASKERYEAFKEEFLEPQMIQRGSIYLIGYRPKRPISMSEVISIFGRSTLNAPSIRAIHRFPKASQLSALTYDLTPGADGTAASVSFESDPSGVKLSFVAESHSIQEVVTAIKAKRESTERSNEEN
jgi:hypothetical protein